MRTEEVTLPGFAHDICSAVHPMGVASPFFREFDWASRGVRMLHPEVAYAHPLDGGDAAVAHRSLDRTAAGLGPDADAYRRLFAPAGRARGRRHRLLPVLGLPPAADPQHPGDHPVRPQRAAQRALAGAPGVRRRARPRADRRGGRARHARPHPAADRGAGHGAVDAGPPPGLAAARGRHPADGRRDGHRDRAAGRVGRAGAGGHRPARVRRRPGRAAGHHARGLRGDGRRPAARRLRALGAAVPPRARRLQDRLGAVGPGAVDQPRRPPGRDGARRRHAGRDHRGGGRAGRRAAHRPALRAGRAAHRRRPDPGAGGQARVLGLRARAARLDGRHDDPDRGAGGAVRAGLPGHHPGPGDQDGSADAGVEPQQHRGRHLQR